MKKNLFHYIHTKTSGYIHTVIASQLNFNTQMFDKTILFILLS